MIVRLLGALLIVFLFAMPAAAQGQAPRNSAQMEADREAAETDQGTLARVRRAFRQLPQFENVFVTVQGGVVTLKGRVLEVDQIDAANELARKVEGVIEVNNQIEVEASLERRFTPAVERFQERMAQFVTYAPIIGIGLIILALMTAIGLLVTRFSWPWDRIAPNRFIGGLLRQVVRLAFLIVGLVLALDVMGATALLSTILGAAGIFGLAFGFAIRDTVENYIASILLSFRQPFRPRDVIAVAGHEGYVIALTSRATVLMTYDGNHVRIPNATVFKSDLTNFTRNPQRRFSFELGVETEDLQRAVDLGVGIIGNLSFTLDDPAPDGWVNAIGDSSMILWFGAWIDQRDTSLVKARSEAIRRVKLAFEAEGIGLPEPIYRLRFDGTQSLPGSDLLVGEGGTQAPPAPPKADRTAMERESDVRPDRAVEEKVREAEAANGDGGLLDEAAPQEIDDHADGRPA